MLNVEIMIKGSIDPEWSDWLDGMEIHSQENRGTHLCGQLPDQSALYGVLSRLNNFGLALVSVRVDEMEDPQMDSPVG